MKNKYKWKKIEAARMTLVALENLENGLVVSTTLTNPKIRGASIKAYAGARHSRSSLSSWEILEEIQNKNLDADERLTSIAVGVGHASVGDLARVQFDLSNIPVHFLTFLFLQGWGNGGQEKSTRYQVKFGISKLHGLKNYLDYEIPQYYEMGKLALKLYNKNFERIKIAFEKYYQPEKDNTAQQNALTSRVLDCVRFFLPWGQCSGATFENSIRDTARIISELKASPILYYQQVGEQIEKLFSPTINEEKEFGFKAEAPGLFKYCDKQETVNKNLLVLKKYLKTKTDFFSKNFSTKKFIGESDQRVLLISKKFTASEKMVAQYILAIYPGLNWQKLLSWIKNQNIKTKKEISKIIFSGHNHHVSMPYLARTTDTSMVIEGFLGEDRDWIRQRAWGRFIPIPGIFGLDFDARTIEQILNTGFGLPENLKLKVFKKEKTAFVADLKKYYQELFSLFKYAKKKYGSKITYEFLLNLIPLAHRVDLWMHGTPNQLPYLYCLRRRPGGHCNYRVLTDEMGNLFAKSDPYLSAFTTGKKINLADRNDFFDRS